MNNVSQKDEISFSQEAFNNSEDKKDVSNDLKEFGVDTEEPDLFSSESSDSNSEDLFEDKNDSEEDDLEIPAFLRRQKN